MNKPKNRIYPFILLAIFALSSFSFAFPLEDESLRVDDKKPLPPTHYVRSRDFDTKHIALNLSFDWEKEQTIGLEEFTFSPMREGFNELRLDAGFMTISSVKLKNGAPLKYSFDEKAEILSINMDREYGLKDTITIVIEYKTKGGSIPTGVGFGGGGGLTFVKPSKSAPNRPWQIWSQGESEYNKYWFPSYDYPNDFRTSEITATVKKPLMVVSNGTLESVKDNGETRSFHWKMDVPYTNYLTSIVVGEYTEIRGTYKDIPVSTMVYKNWEKEGAATAQRLPDMVRFFSEKIGLKYPYKKYAQTIAYGFNGGMENISATTQTDTMIEDSREMLDRDSDGLQAHELAHQWFGDYVTCRDWSEIWLNESFATYMEALYTGESKGKDTFLLENRGNQEQYINAWNRGNRRPIVTKNYIDPDAVFDTYAYARGGAVLHMLRKQLGDENFWRSLNHYLTTNAHQPVSTEELRIAIEETSGQSMDAFFDQWLYRMGHPIFEVTDSFDANTKQLKLAVKQVQKKDEKSEYPQVTYFQTPVAIEIKTANSTRIETVFIKPQAENVFTFTVDSAPLLVNFDYEGTLIKELIFEKSNSELSYQMENDSDVIGRINAMDQLSKRAQAKEILTADKTQIVNGIAARVTADPTWELREEAILNLRSIFVPRSQIEPGQKPAAVALPDSVRNALISATKDKRSNVRSSAIALLGTTQDPSYAPIYKAALSDQSYGVINSAAMALAKSGAPGTYEALLPLLNTPSWHDRIRISGFRALADLGDNRVLETAFALAENNELDQRAKNSVLSVIAKMGAKDPRAFPLVSQSLQVAIDENSVQGIINGLNYLTLLSDPRGQEIFDRVKEKFKGQDQPMNFILNLEKRFQEALKK